MFRTLLVGALLSLVSLRSMDIARRAGTTPVILREAFDAIIGFTRTAPLFDARAKNVLITGASSGASESQPRSPRLGIAHLI